uniref:40S ribosomal protein S12 n=1 Tax=Solanum tuberosum TaxID=4113 RepID=M1DAX2_SOLTU
MDGPTVFPIPPSVTSENFAWTYSQPSTGSGLTYGPSCTTIDDGCYLKIRFKKKKKCQVKTPPPAPLGETIDIMIALQLIITQSMTYGGLANHLHEGAKVIKKHAAQDLYDDHYANLITISSYKTLDGWTSLCKIDS